MVATKVRHGGEGMSGRPKGEEEATAGQAHHGHVGVGGLFEGQARHRPRDLLDEVGQGLGGEIPSGQADHHGHRRQPHPLDGQQGPGRAPPRRHSSHSRP